MDYTNKLNELKEVHKDNFEWLKRVKNVEFESLHYSPEPNRLEHFDSEVDYTYEITFFEDGCISLEMDFMEFPGIIETLNKMKEDYTIKVEELQDKHQKELDNLEAKLNKNINGLLDSFKKKLPAEAALRCKDSDIDLDYDPPYYKLEDNLELFDNNKVKVPKGNYSIQKIYGMIEKIAKAAGVKDYESNLSQTMQLKAQKELEC